MPTRLQKWRALDRREQGTLIGLLVLLPLLRLGLRMAGFERLQAMLTRPAQHHSLPPTSNPSDEIERAERLAGLVAIAGRRGPIPATCLPQALALYWLLGRRGQQPKIRFGVRRVADRVLAHAWVELHGVALAAGDQDQTPLEPGG